MAAVKNPMVCVDCDDRLFATIRQAARSGWKVWLGGARCNDCEESAEVAYELLQHPASPDAPICATCGHTRRWHIERCHGHVELSSARHRVRCACPVFLERVEDGEP